ncbi:MAG: hypothetical protein AAF382_09695 [Pseudomonadota bacterium]
MKRPVSDSPKTCVLHAGAHKTGSTAIQWALQGYDDGETVYADLDHANHSVPLRQAFSESGYDPKWGQFSDADTAAQRRQQVEAALSLDRARVMFSAEGMLRFSTSEGRAFRDLITRFCDRVQVVLFVREPVAWTASLAQQRIKRGGLTNLQVVTGTLRNTVVMLMDVFGPEAVTIWRYEDKDLFGGDITRLFAQRLGLDETRLNPTGTDVNASFPEGVVQMLYQLSRVSPIFEAMRDDPPLGPLLFRTCHALVEDHVPLNPAPFARCVDLEDTAFVNDLIDIPYDLPSPSAVPVEDYLMTRTPKRLSNLNALLVSEGVIARPLTDHDDVLAALFRWALDTRKRASRM